MEEKFDPESEVQVESREDPELVPIAHLIGLAARQIHQVQLRAGGDAFPKPAAAHTIQRNDHMRSAGVLVDVGRPLKLTRDERYM